MQLKIFYHENEIKMAIDFFIHLDCQLSTMKDKILHEMKTKWNNHWQLNYIHQIY